MIRRAPAGPKRKAFFIRNRLLPSLKTLWRGQRVAGAYRRSITLANGRYAMFDDGTGFSLARWKPIIEQWLGQQIAATVRGGGGVMRGGATARIDDQLNGFS
jgi:hypothetical protein